MLRTYVWRTALPNPFGVRRDNKPDNLPKPATAYCVRAPHFLMRIYLSIGQELKFFRGLVRIRFVWIQSNVVWKGFSPQKMTPLQAPSKFRFRMLFVTLTFALQFVQKPLRLLLNHFLDACFYCCIKCGTDHFSCDLFCNYISGYTTLGLADAGHSDPG